MILRNGQNPNSSDEGWTPITEDANSDLSSIYLTSTQKIPLDVPNNNFNSYTTPPTKINQYEEPQAIITSDRVVLNARKDHILLNSQKSINLSSVGTLNVDTKATVINSPSIKLGGNDASESLVKGDTLYRNLSLMVDTLTTLVSVLEVQQLWPGGIATPDGATSLTASATKNVLNSISKDLKNILSKVSKTV